MTSLGMGDGVFKKCRIPRGGHGAKSVVYGQGDVDLGRDVIKRAGFKKVSDILLLMIT